MNSSLVYIVGLSRVGSTLLDLFLGSQKGFVGLGEVYQVLRTDMDRYTMNAMCSCGKGIHDCPVWGAMKQGLQQRKGAPLLEKYQYVLQTVSSMYGPGSTLVDSSKTLHLLRTALDIPNLRVKIIYLIRDVRGWSISRLDNRFRSPQYFGSHGGYVKKLAYAYGNRVRWLGWLFPFVTTRPSYYFWIWYLQNQGIQRFLNHRSVDYLKVAYEELALNRVATLAKISRFLGSDASLEPTGFLHSKSHVVVGNTQKNVMDRRKGIFYDHRWMYRNEWVLPAALFPRIMRYNAREVYGWARKNSMWELSS